MSDFARLKGSLVKLRQRERVSGEGRRLRGPNPEARLAALVTEIDETIRPRRWRLAREDGAVVHFAGANRRLQALAAPAPEIDGFDTAALANQPLPDAEAPEVGQLKDALLVFFADDAPTAIQSSRQAGGGYPSDVGVPAAILARAWNAVEAPIEKLSPDALISEFLGGLGDDAVGWLRIEGENVVDQSGDAAVVESLGEQAAIFLDSYFGKFEKLFPEDDGIAATAVGPLAGSGAAAFFVEAGEISAFVVAKAEKLPELANTWQTLSGI